MKEKSPAVESWPAERPDEVFRVRVSLERYFSDERARCYMAVSGARPVRSLARRLRRTFRLPRPFALLCRSHLLPPAEPLALLRPDDPVEVVPIKSADYLNLETKNMDSFERTSSAAGNDIQACSLNGAVEKESSEEEGLRADCSLVLPSQASGGCDDEDSQRAGHSLVLPSQANDDVDGCHGLASEPPRDTHHEKQLEAMKQRALSLLAAVAPRRRRRARRRARPAHPAHPAHPARAGGAAGDAPAAACYVEPAEDAPAAACNEEPLEDAPAAACNEEPLEDAPAACAAEPAGGGVVRNGGAAERGARLVRSLAGHGSDGAGAQKLAVTAPTPLVFGN